ncbi:MAG: tetratricopeptide repeat protein [Candidatus Bathyarchaeia archaeon]
MRRGHPVPVREQKRALLHLGLVYKGLQYRDQAFGYLRQAWALSREVFDPILTIWESAGFAELYFSTGELDEATALSRQALDLARRKGLRGEVWYLLYLQGRILRQSGDIEGATKAFDEAVKVLKTIAAELTDPTLKKSFLLDKHVVVETLNQLRNQCS